jgi:precorrin-6Y C5,15-methyltransferase (decarboxylating)
MTGDTDHLERIHVIGIDDAGPDGLPVAEQELIAGAELLCGGRRHLALFPAAPAERFCISNNVQELIELLRRAPARRRAVVLASGDPCFYGIAPILVRALGRDRIAVHARASSAALAFARLGVAWQDATVLSVHGRPIEDALSAAMSAQKLALLTDPVHTPACVAEALLDAGMEDCAAYVCERLGGPAERIHALRLAELPGRAFDPLNLLVLLREHTPARARFGVSEDAYESARGQITKAEVRAVTLARLEPWHTSVAWDIGAGSGSVSIELAGHIRQGTVYAVERDPQQLQILKRNLRRHQAAGVRVVAGAAPEALTVLPNPDAVFIGGSGADLEAILAATAERLRPGGRLVANFARLESLACWQRVVTVLGWPQDLVQLSVARGTGIGAATRLAALNPVFIARVQRPDAATHAIQPVSGTPA